MKGESLLLLGIGFFFVRRCRLCVPDSPGGASRFVCDIHNIELSIHQVKSRKSSHTSCHAVTSDSHIHTSHSFSYLSSLPLVTDPIAVASNDYAKDRLHKDHCAQAFGRNTLSKPHNTERSVV